MKKKKIYLFVSIALLLASACKPPEKEYVAPKIWTMQPVEVTTTEATFRANFVKGSEEIMVFGFEWKETLEEDWETVHTQAGNDNYSFPLVNLKKDVQYTVKAFIVDASDSKYFGEEIRFYTNGTVTDIDGNVYSTLRYGDRVWMTENLRVTSYADGTPIEGRSGGESLDSDGPAYYRSGNHTSYFKDPNFGLLYNWAAAIRADNCETEIEISGLTQGVCPNGWRIPSIGEWMDLMISHCGGMDKAGTTTKTKTWSEPYISNTSRFSIEPAGWYYYDEGIGFKNVYTGAYFWTINQTPLSYGVSSYAMALIRENPECHTIAMRKSAGYSIRCVRIY
jgi:uncharacterized protein (TIGR02145 family)